MRLLTKEVMDQAVLVDPAHNNLVESATLHLRTGEAYGFELAEKVKGGLTARSASNEAEHRFFDEEQLAGLSVVLSADAGPKHEVWSLTSLIEFTRKQQRRRA